MRASDNRHYVRREKANGRQARRTSLFDVRCAARLRNARLSDDRPIHLFFLCKGAEAYAIECPKRRFLVFLVLRRIREALGQ